MFSLASPRAQLFRTYSLEWPAGSLALLLPGGLCLQGGGEEGQEAWQGDPSLPDRPQGACVAFWIPRHRGP